MKRRNFFLTPALAAAMSAQQPSKGQLKQCVCGGVFPRGLSLDERCAIAAKMGFVGYDLLEPKDWPTVKKHGLVPSLATGTGTGIGVGMNRVEYHEKFEKNTHELIDIAAKEGVTDIILLTGERRGMSDEQGLENCVKFLNKVKKHAEEKKVVLVTELLNSKVDHPDYMCDHTAWGVEMCKRADSPSVKLLYDIYHMQIMEGDIIRTIRKNYQYMGHFHTAGNPGRHEMDDSQEMNYKGIAKALVDLNYQGYIAHEYSPVKDPLTSLEQTRKLFEVS
jgi:hydroxypyruvate isomerase